MVTKPSSPRRSTSRRVSTSSSQSIRTSISDTKFSIVRRSRPRPHHRSSSASNGNDISFSSTHDSGEDEDIGLWNSENQADFSPELLHPQPVRLRGLSDPPLVLQNSSIFRTQSACEEPPLTYASLPATPIASSPPPPASVGEQYKMPLEQSDVYTAPFSLWDYLREELLATDFDSHQELKWERVGNFLSIPLAIEKVSAFWGPYDNCPPNGHNRSYLLALYYALTRSCTRLQYSLFVLLLLSGAS